MNTDITLSEDTEYIMPCAEALLAATLALMTGHAESACSRQRGCMARKILSNLSSLGRSPDLSASFRSVLRCIEGHWNTLLAMPGETPASADTSSPAHPVVPRVEWHTAPAQVQ